MSIADKYSLLINEKIPQVFNAGTQNGAYQLYNTFFNSYLHSGYFSYTFAGTHWRDEIFVPNKDLKPVWIRELFTMSAIKDIVGCLKKTGRTLDTSKATYIYYIMRQNQYSTNLPFIDTSSCINLTCFLNDNSKLETIEGLKFKNDGSQLFDAKYSFGKLPLLKNIKSVEGVIGQDGVDFSGSPLLNKDTYHRIFNCLSTTTDSKTITFSEKGVDETFKGYGNVHGPTSDISKFTDDCKGSYAEEWLDLIKSHSNWIIKLI